MALPSLKGAWALRPCSVDLQTHIQDQAIYRRRTLPTKNLLLSLRTASRVSIPLGKAFDTVDSQLSYFGRPTLTYSPEPKHLPIRFEGASVRTVVDLPGDVLLMYLKPAAYLGAANE